MGCRILASRYARSGRLHRATVILSLRRVEALRWTQHQSYVFCHRHFCELEVCGTGACKSPVGCRPPDVHHPPDVHRRRWLRNARHQAAPQRPTRICTAGEQPPEPPRAPAAGPSRPSARRLQHFASALQRHVPLAQEHVGGFGSSLQAKLIEAVEPSPEVAVRPPVAVLLLPLHLCDLRERGKDGPPTR